MKLEEWIPEYPSFHDEDFFKKLTSKAEFRRDDSKDEYFGRFFQSQMNIARYMSQWTLYDSLFLYHEMGTGKSALTVAMTELIRSQPDSIFKKIIYITHSTTLIENYKNEIKKHSLRMARILQQETVGWKDPEKIRNKWSYLLSRDMQEFYTFGTLEVARFLPSNDRQRYEHSIFIVDEAHHMVLSKEKKDRECYQSLLLILDSLTSKKVIIMTGTPIRDQPHDLVPLLNLVLPPSQRFQNRHDFMDDYFVVSEKIRLLNKSMNVYQWQPSQKAKFQQLLRGRVSFLKRDWREKNARKEPSQVKVLYMGQVWPPMSSIKIMVHKMTGIQNYIYIQTFQSESGMDPQLEEEEEEEEKQQEVEEGEEVDEEDDDDEEGGEDSMRRRDPSSVFAKSKQASLFVFPNPNDDSDGLFGKTGAMANLSGWSMKADFKNVFWNPSLDTSSVEAGQKFKLQQLRQFSCTYTAVISEILAHPNELVYVFCDLVRGSGILLFMILLQELFRFELIRGGSEPLPDTVSIRPRMMILNDQITDEKNFQKLIEYFNAPRNVKADFCQVILSTSKTKEGISLRNVRQIHIMTPSWNFADTAQAMARSLRALSHVDLVDPTIRVFLHAAVPDFRLQFRGEEDLTPQWKPTPQELQWSIDFQRYERSEIKERNAKLLDRVLMESSWDCILNKPIHSNPNRIEDGSRECEYDRCDYECEGVNVLPPLDFSNVNIFYSTLDRDRIFSFLNDFFHHHSHVGYDLLVQEIIEFMEGEVGRSLVEECISQAMDAPMVFRDGRNLARFLKIDKGICFLVDNPFLPIATTTTSPHQTYGIYYEQHPSSQLVLPTLDLLDVYYLREIPNLLPKLRLLIGAEKYEASIELFRAFPLEFQRLFCETVFVSQFQHGSEPTLLYREWLTHHFQNDVSVYPTYLLHRFVLERSQPRRLNLVPPYVWEDTLSSKEKEKTSSPKKKKKSVTTTTTTTNAAAGIQSDILGIRRELMDLVELKEYKITTTNEVEVSPKSIIYTQKSQPEGEIMYWFSGEDLTVMLQKDGISPDDCPILSDDSLRLSRQEYAENPSSPTNFYSQILHKKMGMFIFGTGRHWILCLQTDVPEIRKAYMDLHLDNHMTRERRELETILPKEITDTIRYPTIRAAGDCGPDCVRIARKIHHQILKNKKK